MDDHLSPARRLAIACEFKIPAWIPDAVRALFMTPLSTITFEEFRALGNAYYIIAHARDTVDVFRKNMALRPPQMSIMPMPFCTDHDACRRIWISMWMKQVVPLILHPSPRPLREVPFSIRSISSAFLLQQDPTRISEACHVEAVRSVEGSPAFSREDQIIDETVASILDAYGAKEDTDVLWDEVALAV